MCCNNNRNRCGCGCGCRRPMPCCPCCGGAMPLPLPSFPDWPVGGWEREEIEFPVYVSMPATMARGTANFTAGVEIAENGCGCARG